MKPETGQEAGLGRRDPVERLAWAMMAPDKCGWTLGWTETNSHSYWSRKAQVQADVEKVRPETGRETGLGHKPGP